MDFGFLRREYQAQPLLKQQLAENPVDQLLRWIQEATNLGVVESNAMFLSTASASGQPSGRIVLLKKVDDRGLQFFTNYHSRKARELFENPHASASFYWQRMERQVTVEGTVGQISAEDSAIYFASRPRSSQIAAWASPQGEPVSDRNVLRTTFEEMERKFKDQPIPPPPHWGGFRIEPNRFEFWQGAPHRLHDRFQYTKQDNHWVIQQLAPERNAENNPPYSPHNVRRLCDVSSPSASICSRIFSPTSPHKPRNAGIPAIEETIILLVLIQIKLVTI